MFRLWKGVNVKIISYLLQETPGGRDEHASKKKECPLDKDELGNDFHFLELMNTPRTIYVIVILAIIFLQCCSPVPCLCYMCVGESLSFLFSIFLKVSGKIIVLHILLRVFFI